MAEYKLCPNCKGKGYTLESNMVTEGLFGLLSDAFGGLYERTCKACDGTGKITIKD